jgi:hypothetical protein
MIKKELKNLVVELRKILDTNSIHESAWIKSYMHMLDDDANLLVMQGYPVEEVILNSIDMFKEYLIEDYDLIKEVE